MRRVMCGVVMGAMAALAVITFGLVHSSAHRSGETTITGRK